MVMRALDKSVILPSRDRKGAGIQWVFRFHLGTTGPPLLARPRWSPTCFYIPPEALKPVYEIALKGVGGVARGWCHTMHPATNVADTR